MQYDGNTVEAPVKRSLSKQELEVKAKLEQMIKDFDAEKFRVETKEIEGNRITFEVYCDRQEDRGKLIGKNGRNINALQILLKAFAMPRGVIFSGIHVND
jgi:predicted RNA-binding protein YlqC (UPF0109 family)